MTPEEVAIAMLDLLEKDECQAGRIKGGCILEIGKEQVRFVSEFNDPGPSGAGHSVSGIRKATDQVLASLGEEGWGRLKH